MNEINKEKLIEYIVNLQQEDGSKKNENYFFSLKHLFLNFLKVSLVTIGVNIIA